MIDYSVISLHELLKHELVDEAKLLECFKKFSCSQERDLENFLVHLAVSYEYIEFGKTFLIIDNNKLNNEEIEIAAFFTLGQVSVDISILSKKQKRKIIGSVPGRDGMASFSGYLIGQLGRCDKYTKDQLPGSIILDECHCRLEVAQTIVGGKLVLLECRPALQRFYEGQGFKKLTSHSDGNLFTYYKRL